jgi:hypothetical protein
VRHVLFALVLSGTALAKPSLKEEERPYGTTQPPKFGENAPRNYQSSQWFAFELKMGSYTPDIDSSPGLNGATPFADLFNPQGTTGRPAGRLLTSLEFDVQFYRKVGSIGVGTSIGYYRRTTHSFQYPGGGEPTTVNGRVQTCTVNVDCVRSGDQTALNIIPLELMLVYRFDWLMLRYRVPFVPYVKIGLAYYIWIIENGGGAGSVASWTSPTGDKSDGYGGTFGWVINPGLAFQLDVIDSRAARAMDAELGINHSYLFAELHYADISGFGASDKLVLSDLSWNVGLAFEF